MALDEGLKLRYRGLRFSNLISLINGKTNDARPLPRPRPRRPTTSPPCTCARTPSSASRPPPQVSFSGEACSFSMFMHWVLSSGHALGPQLRCILCITVSTCPCSWQSSSPRRSATRPPSASTSSSPSACWP